MITLKIKKQDGSSYWTEHFDSRIECDKWLNEEKKRPYWNQSYTIDIQDRTAEVAEQRRLAALKIQDENTKRDQLGRYFKNLKRADITPENIPDIIMNIKKYILGDL